MAFAAGGSNAPVERLRINGSTGVISLGAAPGAESLRVTPVASAVNYVDVLGAATGASPSLSTQGSDAAINFSYSTKGTGSHRFYTNSLGNEQLRITHTASAVNYLNITGQATTGSPALSAQGSDTNISLIYISKGIGGHIFASTNGANIQFLVANTTSAVNYLQVTGQATGSAPTISAQGSDANVGLYFKSKGTFGHVFANGASQTQFSVYSTASAVNYLEVTGNSMGLTPSISSQGSDTNIDIALTPKGAGVLSFGTYTAGVVVQAGYITIKDAGGTTRRLLVG